MGPRPAVEVLHEDNHLLAVAKPAGLPVQGDATGDPSLVDWARDYLKTKYQKPGNVFVGLVHRLDRPVSGVVLLARTGKAADRLSAQFRAGTVRKVYWAFVEGDWGEAEGTWRDLLRKDATRNVSAVVPQGDEGGGREAVTRFRQTGRVGDWTAFELEPLTGRSHQLRVQLAARGLTIAGDVRYGSRRSLPALDGGSRIALHARLLCVTHPTRGGVVELRATAPADWPGPDR